jgi:hypothetical protein
MLYAGDVTTGKTWDNCRAKCALKKNATGCEAIWNQSNAGCYVHFSKAVDRGNNRKNHFCTIAKSQYKRLTKTRPTTDSEGNKVITPEKCVFPFSYRGITYTTCRKPESSKAWCSVVPAYKSGMGSRNWYYCEKP